ncbi:hypothetical protein SELMODRAFT_126675, partial [Selaginella moellendorffii]
MLHALASNGHLGEAKGLFDSGMPCRSIISWTSLLQGYSESGQFVLAKELFDAMPEWNIVSSTAMFQALARNGEIDAARALFDAMPLKNIVSWNTLI